MQTHLLRARARTQSGVLATAAVLLLVAASVVTGVVAFGEAQATRGLRQAVRELPPAVAVAEVRAALPGGDADTSPAAQDAAVTEDVENLLDGAPADLSRSVRSGLLDVVQPATEGLRLVAVSYQDLPAHADLLAGSWPTGPDQAALHAAAAKTAGVSPGDTVVVDGADKNVTLTVTGTWEPASATDPYFGGEPLEATGAESPTVAGPLVVDDVAAAGLDDRPTVRWRLAPNAAQVRPGDLGALASAVQRLRATVTGDPRLGADVQVSADGGQALGELARRVVLARSVSALPAVVVAALAGAALLLVARLLADARAGETTLVRARGASARQVAGWVVLEAVALAVPVAVLAPPLGWLLTRLAGAPAPLGTELWVSGALVALLGAVLLLAPSLAEARRWSVVAAGPSRRTRVLRRGADLVLLVVAAVAVWQLRQYGAAVTPGSTSGAGPAVDPLLVAAPALALVAGAVLAIRLLPPLAAAAQRALTRRRSLPAALTAWEVARRPATHGVPLVVVALSVAAGVFAAGYTASWQGLQEDVAVQRTGADVRVAAPATGSTLPSSARDEAYADLDGVQAVTTVSTSDGDASSTELTLLALDTATAEQTVRTAEGTGTDAAALTAALRPDSDAWPGVPLPDGTQRIVVHLALGQQGFETGIPGVDGAPQVSPSLWLGSPTGEAVAIPLGVRASAGSADVDVPLPRGGPWTVTAVELAAETIFRQDVTYSLAVTGVDAVDAAGAQTAVDPAAAAWRELNTAAPVHVAPPQVTVGGPGWPSVELATLGSGPQGHVRTRVGAGGLSNGPAPAVVDTTLAAANEVTVGDVLTVSRAGVATPLKVVDVVDRLPGLTGAGAAVDLRALSAGDLARGVTPPAANEWWLAVAPEASDDVAAAVRSLEGAPAQVTSVQAVADDLGGDPLGGAAVGAFDLGLVAAVALVGVGLAVAAAATARRRRVEVAVMRALGVTARQVRAVLAAEQAAVAVVAVLAGLAVGALVSWLTLPYLVVAAGSTVLLPLVRFSGVAIAAVVAAVALAVALAVAGRTLAARRRPPAADVRLGADL